MAAALWMTAPSLLAAVVAPCHEATGPRQAYDYPIVLKGPPAFAGVRVTNVGAYALRDGAFREIPVQVEEVNANGDYVLEGGMPFTAKTDDGIFDDNDEVVLDGATLGDDFTLGEETAALVKPGDRGFKVDLCRGSVSIGHALLIGYLGYHPSNFLPAVVFDKDKAEVTSSLYRYVFHKKHPALLGEVLMKQNGIENPVLKDSRFRMPLKTPFYLPDMTFEEDDFTSAIESWQSGPLRSIVAVGVKYSAFVGLFKLHLFSELVFYRNRFVIPTVIEFIFDPRSVLKPGSGIAYSLSFPEGKSWTIDGNLQALPAKSPKEIVEDGVTAAGTEVFVVRGRGPDGSFVAQVRVDPKARAEVPPPFLIRREQFLSKEHQKIWPWLKELPGDVGVYLDFSRVPKGQYDFGLDLLLSPKADQSFTDYGLVDSSWQSLPLRP